MEFSVWLKAGEGVLGRMASVRSLVAHSMVGERERARATSASSCSLSEPERKQRGSEREQRGGQEASQAHSTCTFLYVLRVEYG